MGTFPEKKTGTTLLTKDILYASSSGLAAAGSVLQGYGASKAASASAANKLVEAERMRIEAEEERQSEMMAADAALGAANAQIAANGIVGGSPEESVMDSWDRAFGAAALAYETRLNETRALQRQARADLKAGRNAVRGSILGALGTFATGRANYLQATNKTGKKKPFVPSLLVPTDPSIDAAADPKLGALQTKVPVKTTNKTRTRG